MPSVFSRIVAGELPCHRVAEDERHLAFMDITPIKKGHVLVIPKREEDYIFDLTDEELGALMVFSKKVAKALKAVIPCRKVSMSVIGIEVPHAHVHLIPIDTVQDASFSNPKLQMTAEELRDVAESIAKEFK